MCVTNSDTRTLAKEWINLMGRKSRMDSMPSFFGDEHDVCRTEECHIGWTQSVKHICYINDVQFNNLPARFDRVPMYLSGLGAFFFMKPVEPSSPAHLLKREHKQNWISPTTNPQELSGGIWGLTCFSSSFMKGASRPLRLWRKLETFPIDVPCIV